MTCTQERFLADAGSHTMTVLHDDGALRHLAFRTPGRGSTYWFEIVTWPGVLAIRGDCGSYLFSRETDMFGFFRKSARDRYDPDNLAISPRYWMEKIIAVDSNSGREGSAKKFSEDVFKREVIQWFRRYTSEDFSYENRKDRWMIWKAVRELLEQVDSCDESHNWRLLRDFEVWNDEECEYQYKDFFCDWESSCQEYDFHFLWNLYAIAWAIQKYDAHMLCVAAEH